MGRNVNPGLTEPLKMLQAFGTHFRIELVVNLGNRIGEVESQNRICDGVRKISLHELLLLFSVGYFGSVANAGQLYSSVFSSTTSTIMC